MRLFEEKSSAGTRRAAAWLGITLFALVSSGAGAAAFPITISQDRNSDDATAKLFVGKWKGQISQDQFADKVLVFKMEGDRLTGTYRARRVFLNPGGVRWATSDKYIPITALTVEGKTLTWKIKDKEKPEIEYSWKATLVSDDEILVEVVRGLYRPDQTLELTPVSFKLKKEI
jgi:hypothetical protein